MAFRGANVNDTVGTTGSVTKPAGTIDGDLIVLWAITDAATGTVTWPAGFTETSVTPLRSSVTDASSFFVATKVASGEGASWAITTSVNSKRGAAVFSGRDTTTPIHRISGVSRTTAGGSPWAENSAAFSGGNTSIAGCDIAMVVDDDADLNGPCTHTAPAGFTKQAEHAGADIYSGVLYTKDAAAAGETGAYSGTGAITGSTADRNIVVLALAPAAGGGASAPPQRGCLTMIADRMAKTIMLSMAVHTVVGRHELRGAAQRTKVALPVIKTVRITPPKVTTDILPYPRKGAVIKKPRPFAELFLTRKPLPTTKSVVLPHMLKGAPQRKPRLLPEMVTSRTPFPIARPFVGKPVFVTPPEPVRIIIDPTTTTVRIPLPIARNVIARAVIQHPTTGSGAPILSMIEMDLPVARSAIPRRTVLQPPPPAISRARPTLALTRTPKPVVESFVGAPRPRASTPAKSIARPVLSLVRSLKPVAETFVATARRVAAPVLCRARPLLFRFRTGAPHVQATAGSGIARGTAVQLQLAIARSDATTVIPLGTSAKTALVQNSATTPLGASNSATTALAWQTSAITPLDTSE